MAVKWHLKVGYVSSSSAGMLTTPASSPSDMLANEVYLSLFQFSMIQLLVGADKAANFRGGQSVEKQLARELKWLLY